MPGIATFQPQGRFVFNRSYVKQIVVSDQAPDITMVDNVITTMISAAIGYQIKYVLAPEWLPWNSNRYTLDFLVTDCYWLAFFDGVHHNQDYGVAWLNYLPHAIPSIQIFNPFIRTDEQVFALSSASVPYWLDGTEN